jgi:hypothetical protein
VNNIFINFASKYLNKQKMKVKQTLFAIVFLLSSVVLMAQVADGEKTLREQKKDSITGWQTGGMISLNFSQTTLTNWSAGGQNSFSGNGLVSLFANYKQKKMVWDNSLDIGYGMLRQGKDDVRKTDDKIDLLSKYGREAFGNWYFAGLAHFKTQMAPGYDYPNDSVVISKLFAPAYSLIAVGMDFKPTSEFNLFLSPLTGKFTFVNDQTLADAGAFGVDPAEYDDLGNLVKAGKKSRAEVGGYVRLFYKRDLFENVTAQTKLDIFSNYLDNPQNMDINWEVLISMKINKFITATIATHLIYDEDIMIGIDVDNDGTPDYMGPRTQFKSVFAIGFSYKFNNEKKKE